MPCNSMHESLVLFADAPSVLHASRHAMYLHGVSMHGCDLDTLLCIISECISVEAETFTANN